MFLQPIDIFVCAWLIIAVLCAAYVTWDQFSGNPEASVMKWGFVLITLYMGPIGLLLYVMADKEPRPGTHEAFIKPLWKQGVGSTVHCIAGDATGIILAAVCVALIGLPMWLDLIIEYIAGFSFGLFIFQSLFMRKVMGGSYLENVRKTFLPEFISMNSMMSGMAPVMALLMMGRDMRAMWPGEPLFWFVMSLGICAGFTVAYPVNVWLVSRGMKHGLMTMRGDSNNTNKSGHGAQDRSHQPDRQHENHDSGAHGSDKKPTRAQLAAVTGFTVLMLLAGLSLPSAFVNLRLTAHQVGKLIMPPEMIMTPETSAETMHDMAAIDPRQSVYSAPPNAHGDQTLQPEIVNGIKVFHLTLETIRWHILNDKTVNAYAVNRQVPGPRIELGSTVKIRFIGSHNSFVHPMHIHGGPFEVVARDGLTLPPDQRFMADTINVGPGQRYDVLWRCAMDDA